MIRNLKTLGLALMAVFAMSALAASSASAQTAGHITGSTHEFTLLGFESGAVAENSLTAFGNQTRCPGSTYTGHKVMTHAETTAVPPKTHQPITSGETTVTLTPHYNQENCVSITPESTLSSTVDMNGCDYVLHSGVTTGEVAGTYGVTADVVCPTGQHILVTAFSSESHAFRLCTVTVGPQTGLSGAHLTNEAGGIVRLKGSFTGIKATRSGLCGAATTETAVFHVNAEVEGDNKGSPVSVSISD